MTRLPDLTPPIIQASPAFALAVEDAADNFLPGPYAIWVDDNGSVQLRRVRTEEPATRVFKATSATARNLRGLLTAAHRGVIA